MKVLMISPMYPSQHNPVVGIFIKRQVQALQHIGVEVILVADSRSTPRRNLFHRYRELFQSALKHSFQEFDVVHVHFPTLPGLYGGMIAKMRRKPFVVTLHGAEIDEKQYEGLAGWKRWLTKHSAGWSLKQAAAVVTVGPELGQLALRTFVPASKLSVIDMGVDCQLFRPRSKHEQRQELGIDSSSSAPLVLFVGSLLPIKGPQYFIQAAGVLKKAYPTCRWYLVGQGQFEPELRNLVQQLGIAEQVFFAGQANPDEVAKWNAASDIVVVPSLAEGFGLAGLEGLACGTPVVASNVGGLPSFVTNGVNGFLVPPADPEAIANRVHSLLTDPQLRHMMGQNGIKTAASHDVHTQARKLLAIYEQVTRDYMHGYHSL